MKKKCVFPKLGTKKHQLGKYRKKGKSLTSNARARALVKWKEGWFESN